ncbi:MAG: TonB-dependent receptor, partial [Terracidiphilus sp.]
MSAQSLSGSITGVVTDPSGAVVPGAHVTVTDINKAYVFTSVTDSAGRYVVRNLNPGDYRLAVTEMGFKTFDIAGIVIQVNENTSKDVTLQVGSTSQTVNVVNEAPLLETQDATLGATINRDLVNDMPLIGRDVLTLTYLTPGVTQAQGQTLNAAGGSEGNDLNFVSDGQRNATAALYVDGVVTSQSDPNPGVVRPLYIPTVDAVQEFQVEQGIIRADTGFSGGTVVNIVTRSGTNNVHGTLYDFDQNTAFNANSYANNYFGLNNQPSNTNIYGGVIGGPIKKDKTFFFLVFNGSQSFYHSTSVAWVPSTAERAGNFAEICQTGFDGSGKCMDSSPQTNFGQLWDPYTAQISSATGDITSQAYIPYNNLATYVSPGPPADEYSSVVLPSGPGNIIDPSAQIIMNTAFPSPNIKGAPENAVNYYGVTSGTGSGEETDLRLDQRFTDKDNLIAKFAYGWGNQDQAGCLPGLWNPCSNGPNTGLTYQVALNYSRAISSRTLLQLQGGVISNHLLAPGIASQYPDFDQSTSLGMPSYMDSAGVRAAPQIFYAGDGLGVVGSKTWAAWNMHFMTWQLGGNLDLQRGKHDIKVGGDWRRQSNAFFEAGVPAGQFYFGNAGTALDSSAGTGGGNSLASLMVGSPLNGDDYQNTTPLDVANPDYDVYAQDTWRFTPKLTLDLGVRYEIQAPETDAGDRIVWFDPNAPSPLAGYSGLPNLKGTINFAGELSGKRTAEDTSFNNVQPRIGLAFQLDNKTVVRGGYGIFYLPSISSASGITSGNSTAWYSWTGGGGYLYNAGDSNDGATPAARLSNPFPGGILVPFGLNPSPLAFVGLYDNAIAVRTSTVPYQQTWTLGVQRDLPAQSLLTIYYVGTKGTHLYDAAAGNLDHLPASVDTMSPAQIAAIANTYVPYPFYGAPVPEGCLSYNITCYSYDAEYQNMLPFPQFDALSTNNAPYGNSIYHALQAQYQKRLTHGLQVQASYTWAKSIDDSSVVDGNTAYLSGG